MPHNIDGFVEGWEQVRSALDGDDDELLGDGDESAEIIGWRIKRDKWRTRYYALKKRCIVKARKVRKRKLKRSGFKGGWGRFLKKAR